MEATHGKLWQTSHEAYAYLRKVEPMNRAFKELGIQAQLVGVRSGQTSHRKSMNVLNITDEGILKICPILHWTDRDVQRYMDSNSLPRHPLELKGYVTVGDTHSSRPVTREDKDVRATRFNGKHEECGLHIPLNRENIADVLKIPRVKPIVASPRKRQD